MDALQTTRLLVVTATLALIGFAVALLLVQKTPRKDQALLLATFLGLYGLVKVHQILQVTGVYPIMPRLSGVVFPIMMLLGPAVYCYARAMTSEVRRGFVRRDSRLLVGFLVVLVLNIPYLILSDGEKIALITHRASESQLAAARFRYYVLYFIYLCFSIACLIAALRLLLHHVRRLRSLFSNIDNKSLAWLRTVLFILAAGWSCDVAAEIWSSNGDAPIWLNFATSIIQMGCFATIAFFGVLRPPIIEAAAGDDKGRAAEGEKYARSALSPERMTRIAAKLGLAMTRDKLFEDPDVSLRALSDHVGVSENYISQTLNDHLGKNFFDFVNGYRVAEACRRLEVTSESIAAIAFAVGFQSRSTFNAAFKRHAGRTPREHRAAQTSEAGADQSPLPPRYSGGQVSI